MKIEKPDPNLRILDANLNRLREGTRVIEDIARYLYNNKDIALRFKELRHRIRSNEYERLLQSREIKTDCLKESTKSESSRENLQAIVIANFKRAQESSRVLEEFAKLEPNNNHQLFKNIRYELYDLEKAVIQLLKLHG